MTPDPVVLDLEVDVARDEVYRSLGYREGSRRSAKAQERLEELWPQAVRLVHPRGAYRVVDAPDVAAAGMPEPAATVGVGLCTIGPALEDEVTACTGGGRLLDGVLLDAFGSVAAEAAADALNLHLCEVAEAGAFFAAPRVSPGYGAWDVRFQGKLLSLLPAEKLGVTLTSGQMMVPRKSVSFAVSFDEEARIGHTPGSRCERCGLERCRHRLAPMRVG